MNTDDVKQLYEEKYALKECLKELIEIRRLQVTHCYQPGYEARVNKAWDSAEQLVED